MSVEFEKRGWRGSPLECLLGVYEGGFEVEGGRVRVWREEGQRIPVAWEGDLAANLGEFDLGLTQFLAASSMGRDKRGLRRSEEFKMEEEKKFVYLVFSLLGLSRKLSSQGDRRVSVLDCLGELGLDNPGKWLRSRGFSGEKAEQLVPKLAGVTEAIFGTAQSLYRDKRGTHRTGLARERENTIRAFQKLFRETLSLPGDFSPLASKADWLEGQAGELTVQRAIMTARAAATIGGRKEAGGRLAVKAFQVVCVLTLLGGMLAACGGGETETGEIDAGKRGGLGEYCSAEVLAGESANNAQLMCDLVVGDEVIPSGPLCVTGADYRDGQAYAVVYDKRGNRVLIPAGNVVLYPNDNLGKDPLDYLGQRVWAEMANQTLVQAQARLTDTAGEEIGTAQTVQEAVAAATKITTPAPTATQTAMATVTPVAPTPTRQPTLTPTPEATATPRFSTTLRDYDACYRAVTECAGKPGYENLRFLRFFRPNFDGAEGAYAAGDPLCLDTETENILVPHADNGQRCLVQIFPHMYDSGVRRYFVDFSPHDIWRLIKRYTGVIPVYEGETIPETCEGQRGFILGRACLPDAYAARMAAATATRVALQQEAAARAANRPRGCDSSSLGDEVASGTVLTCDANEELSCTCNGGKWSSTGVNSSCGSGWCPGGTVKKDGVLVEGSGSRLAGGNGSGDLGSLGYTPAERNIIAAYAVCYGANEMFDWKTWARIAVDETWVPTDQAGREARQWYDQLGDVYEIAGAMFSPCTLAAVADLIALCDVNESDSLLCEVGFPGSVPFCQRFPGHASCDY